MKHVKSERLKKLESELQDLEEWKRLGLVPKKDLQKHQDEIEQIKSKIQEEKDRLQFLKESGELEEYVTPKKNTTRSASYTDMPTIPDIDVGESSLNASESGFDIESNSGTYESGSHSYAGEDKDEDENSQSERADEDSDEESYFSEKNRWRRGGIVDPDADEW